MSTLIVFDFDGIHTADEVLNRVRSLQKEHLVDLEDACVVERDGAGKIHIKQAVNLTAVGATSGGAWGVLWGGLVGLLFLNPLAGMAVGGLVGAGTGALSGPLIDYGIDDNLIRSLAQDLKPDSSALFLLVRKSQPERVLAELSHFRGHVLRTSLSPEQEARLQAALSGVVSTAQDTPRPAY